MKSGEWQWGAAGQAFFREVQNSYLDGISQPRKGEVFDCIRKSNAILGPSPREVSNAFFQKKPDTILDRTALLVGWVCSFPFHAILIFLGGIPNS